MNKFTSIIRPLVLICGLSAGLASAALEEKQTQYLDNIANKLQTYVVDSAQWDHNFLDMNNKESYVKHVNRFNDMLMSFKRDVLSSLQAEKSTFAPAGNSEYGQAIHLIHDIVSTLYNQANEVYKILDRNRGNVISLGM